MPGGRTNRPRGHAPGRDRRGFLRRATATAMTPHAGEPERHLHSRARRRPGTGGLKGRLSPRGCDHVVVHVVEEPGFTALSETLSRRPEPTTSSGPTRQETTPPARKEATVRSLQGSQGEPPTTSKPPVSPWTPEKLPHFRTHQEPRSPRAVASRGRPTGRGRLRPQLGCAIAGGGLSERPMPGPARRRRPVRQAAVPLDRADPHCPLVLPTSDCLP